MGLLLLIVLGSLGLLYAGVTFYQTIDWNEPVEPGPDLRLMRKKEAELLHMEDLLTEARRQGKISRGALEEFHRYSTGEIQAMKTMEIAWQKRPRNPSR